MQLIGQRLVTGQALTDSNVTLGQGIGLVVAGTVGTVGKVAANTVTAPITVLEGRNPLPVQRRPGQLDTILRGDPTE